MKKVLLGLLFILSIIHCTNASANVKFELEFIPNPHQAINGTGAKLVNDDGSHIVLYGHKKGRNKEERIPLAFHWSKEEGHTPLGLLNNRNVLIPMDISDDGRVVVGHNGGDSFVWTKRDKMKTIPKLKNNFVNTAISISGDGKTVVGYTGWQSDVRAFSWKINGELQEIGTGKDKVSWRSALRVSKDGRVIAGSTQENVYVWKEPNIINNITAPEECNFFSEEISDDGYTIGGRCGLDLPLVWNEFYGFKSLPVPIGASNTFLTAMSGDGKRILGSVKYKGNDYKDVRKPILWLDDEIYFLDNIIREQRGTAIMKSIWVENISSNGKVIVGGYKNNNGYSVPWKLTIIEQ